MITINFIFSIGFRCNSCDFLKKYDMRHAAGPFDYLFIDIETAFENISNDFENFLSDIVHINKNKKIYASNSCINEKLLKFTENKRICYMRDDYEDYDLFFNQNFLNNTPYNLYDWDRICLFIHHKVTSKEIQNKLFNRIERFKKIYKEKNEALCLLYITKIEETNNFEEYKQHIHKLKQKYNIQCYIVVIVCSDRLEETSIFEEKILFIVKRVQSYKEQFSKGTDNNDLNFNKEYITFLKNFSLETTV